MLPEVRVLRILKNSHELTTTLNELRGTPTAKPLIFTSEIPEKYTLYKTAPMMRINFINDNWISADDDDFLNKPKLAVNFWTKSLADSEKLTPIVRKVLRAGGFIQYDSVRERDPDSGSTQDKQLYMNVIFVQSKGEPVTDN